MRNCWVYFFFILNFVAFSIPSEAQFHFDKTERRTVLDDLKYVKSSTARQQLRSADTIEKKQTLMLWALCSFSIEVPNGRKHHKIDLFQSALLRFQIGNSRAPPVSSSLLPFA